MNKLFFKVIGAQGRDNKVSTKSPDIWMTLESPIGFTEAHKGILFNIPVYAKGDTDIVIFMLNDFSQLDETPDSYVYIAKLTMIPRADQGHMTLLVNEFPDMTSLYLNLDMLTNG